MDSSNPHGSTSTSHSSNGENEDKVSTMIQSKRAEFWKAYERQRFSLPDSIMFYIIKNPASAELYQKTIQTCKDFFVKNPIIIISHLNYTHDEWYANQKPFDLDNLTFKFWITSKFHVRPSDDMENEIVIEKIVSSIIPKIFRCDVKELTLYDQIISFADLSLLISTAEDISLANVAVKDNNGTVVEIEKIVEVSVKAKRIQIRGPPISSISSKTMKDLMEIPSFCNLNNFSLYQIPESFDVEAFYVYMKKNKLTRIYLDFDDFVSQTYKNRLEEIVDEIVATETFGYKPPFIRFPGISAYKANELYKCYYSVRLL